MQNQQKELPHRPSLSKFWIFIGIILVLALLIAPLVWFTQEIRFLILYFGILVVFVLMSIIVWLLLLQHDQPDNTDSEGTNEPQEVLQHGPQVIQLHGKNGPLVLPDPQSLVEYPRVPSQSLPPLPEEQQQRQQKEEFPVSSRGQPSQQNSLFSPQDAQLPMETPRGRSQPLLSPTEHSLSAQYTGSSIESSQFRLANQNTLPQPDSTMSPAENMWLQEKERLLQDVAQLQERNARLLLENGQLQEEKRTLLQQPHTRQPVQPVLVRSVTPYSLPPIKREGPARIEDMQVREPEDTRDLATHPHVRIFPAHRGERSSLRGGWQLIAASRRGLAHERDGKYREDDFNIQLVGEEVALVAIADGIGSKSLSRHGARAATLGATTNLPEQRLAHFAKLVNNYPQDERCKEEAAAIMNEALTAAHHSVRQRTSEDGVSIDQLGSTLLLFLVVPCSGNHLFVASFQIGDGALYTLQPERAIRWQFLQQPQLQEAGNEVRPFMQIKPDQWRQFFSYAWIEYPTFVMGMTDGIASDLEPPPVTLEDPKPDPFWNADRFYQHIESSVLRQFQPETALGDFLAYREQQSFDDRTLVCLYRLRERR